MTAFDGYIGSMTALIAIGALYLHLIYGSMITFDKLGFILAFAGYSRLHDTFYLL